MVQAKPRPTIINISMDLEPFPQVKEKLRTLSQSGDVKSILVFSAGNDGTTKPLDSVRKEIPGVVVGSLHPSGFLSADSVSDERVTILAPGDDWAISQVDKAAFPGQTTDAYVAFGGTSAATPLVSGALAKATSVLKGLTLDEASLLLKNSAIPTAYSGTNGGSGRNGAGILNDYRMMKVAQRFLESDWPNNRELLKTETKKLFDFKQEAQDAYLEAKKLLQSKDCSQLRAGLFTLRKAFLLDPTRKEILGDLKKLYDKEGLSVQSEFIQSLMPGGMADVAFTALTTERPASDYAGPLNPDDETSARRYISESGYSDGELLKKFERVIQNPITSNPELREKIFNAAMSIGGSPGLSFIQKAKNDSDPEVRKDMLSSIQDRIIFSGQSLTPEQKSQLLKYYSDAKSDSDVEVRMIAARGCTNLRAACLTIVRPFLQDKDPRVRRAAVTDLYMLGKDALPFVQALEHDRNSEVASVAKMAIELIQSSKD